MAWNDPIAPVPDYGARPNTGAQPVSGQPPAFAPAGPAPAMPPIGPAPVRPAPAPQPLGVQPFQMAPQAPQYAPPGMTAPQQPGSFAGGGMPAGAAQDNDQPDAGDDVWIERTKRAIAESQNDPYRQVQLLQHLNKLYLKERFGREVQADKG